MAMLHVTKKLSLSRAEAVARDFTVSDSWADYGFTLVPFTGDKKPNMDKRMRRALEKAKLVYNRLLWGCSSAGQELQEVVMFPSNGEERDGVAVLRVRFPMGD